MYSAKLRPLVLALFLGLAVLLIVPAGPALAGKTQQPLGLIFDTDMGNDIDDALALALIHALQDRGECRLLAVTLTNDTPHAAAFVDLVNTFYGRGAVLVGLVRKGATHTPSYTKTVVERKDDQGRPLYPHSLRVDSAIPEATAVLRQTLAKQPDQSILMVQVGFSTNLTRLLDTPGDRISPLTGKELVAKKVKLLSIMGGQFAFAPGAKKRAEYNIHTDRAAAQRLFAEWPTPIVASGFEIGEAIEYPARSIQLDFAYAPHHPIAEAYRAYEKFPYDRPTWDLTSVLQAVRPRHGYFGLSQPGTISVSPESHTDFRPTPQGQHRYLTASPEQIVRVREALTMLVSQPPLHRANSER